jgi:capsid protein
MAKALRTAAELAVSRKAGKTAFGYNVVEDGQRRRPVKSKNGAEALFLTPQKREKATATARDDRRNFTILAWMIRRHLDNVSRFTPHFRITGGAAASPEVRAVNAIADRLLRWHGKPRQFDATGRHGRSEWMRIFEACKIIDGDVLAAKIKGGRLQGIEGTRIAKVNVDGRKLSPEIQKTINENGLRLDAAGNRTGYSVCQRVGSGLEFERLLSASDAVYDGYWPERYDSDRGVSPLLSCLNEGADVRETWEWLVLKAKTSAIFGLAFTRTGSDEMTATQGATLDADGAPANESAAYSTQISNAIKGRGLINLDLDPGDDVKEIQSNTPNPQVIGFTRELIRSILLALDIPFTFYDSLTASFSARIADRNEYEESCEWKREKNEGVLDEIYGGWLFPMWAAADVFGFGTALEAAKVSVEEAAAILRWVPAGKPWLDRSGEMSGHILELAAGVTSTPRICAAYGEDAYAIAEEQKAYLEQAGAPLLYAQGGQVAVQAIMAGMRNAGQPPAETQQPAESGGRKDDE